MCEKLQGIKNILIRTECTYPIVSAYEFEFLKTESIVKKLLKPATIYLIVQRPLIYINNLCIEDGLILFDIIDVNNNSPLKCIFNPYLNGFFNIDEDINIELQFYKPVPDTVEPYNDIAGVQLRNLEGKFVFWFTPQKFIHHFLTKRLKVEIEGNINNYINYHIHYIGKAFSQDVWSRLTGHEKMQSILTRERAIDAKSSLSSFEISLVLLNVVGFDEANISPLFDSALDSKVKPIVYDLDSDESYEKFYTSNLATDSIELTNEVEAMLVNTFQPVYNEIKFKIYPEIETGTRSAGYTQSNLIIENLPAILSSEHCQSYDT